MSVEVELVGSAHKAAWSAQQAGKIDLSPHAMLALNIARIGFDQGLAAAGGAALAEIAASALGSFGPEVLSAISPALTTVAAAVPIVAQVFGVMFSLADKAEQKKAERQAKETAKCRSWIDALEAPKNGSSADGTRVLPADIFIRQLPTKSPYAFHPDGRTRPLLGSALMWITEGLPFDPRDPVQGFDGKGGSVSADDLRALRWRGYRAVCTALARARAQKLASLGNANMVNFLPVLAIKPWTSPGAKHSPMLSEERRALYRTVRRGIEASFSADGGRVLWCVYCDMLLADWKKLGPDLILALYGTSWGRDCKSSDCGPERLSSKPGDCPRMMGDAVIPSIRGIVDMWSDEVHPKTADGRARLEELKKQMAAAEAILLGKKPSIGASLVGRKSFVAAKPAVMNPVLKRAIARAVAPPPLLNVPPEQVPAAVAVGGALLAGTGWLVWRNWDRLARAF